MADRLPQYPMLPNNFNPNLLQQQHMSQAQQQPQVDLQSVPGLTNAEHGRMWQQMQQHMQNQYRPQNGVDISGSQVNQQVAELLRSQNMARVQSQQSMGQQQQQQFGLGGQQMSNQQSPFHDQANQQQAQSHLPPNFGGMGMQNSSQLQSSMQSRNAMMQPFTGNQRQLELMTLAQNQHPQNGSNHYATRLAQQQQSQSGMNGLPVQNQSQLDIFSSPAMPAPEAMRNSPSHSAAQPAGSMVNQPQQMSHSAQGLPAGRRHMTFPELKERAQQLQNHINQFEASILQLQNQRAGTSDVTFTAKMQTLTSEVKNRREILAKVMQAMQAARVSAMSSSGPLLNGQNQPGWSSQSGTSQSQVFGNGQMGGPTQGQSTQPTSIGPVQGNHVLTQNIPPRSGPTPQQLMPGQLPNRMSPFPFQMNGTQAGQAGAMAPTPQTAQSSFSQIPPLEKSLFESAYSNFCKTRGLVHDPRCLVFDNRPIDLFALHVQVMTTGGHNIVTQKELWSTVGGRMGFVQFPGTDSEPGKSGPGVAQHLANVYKDYLLDFDSVYVHSVMQSKRKMQENQVHQAQQMNMSSGQQSNASRPPTAQQMQMVMAYSHLSGPDLRAKGVSEKLIQFVEQNRANLQRTAHQQQAFRGIVANKPNQTGASVQSANQDRGQLSGSGPFSNQKPQQITSMVNDVPHSNGHPPLYTQQQPGMPTVPGVNNMDPQFRQPTVPPLNGTSTPQAQQAIQFILKVKHEFMSRNIPHMAYLNVPDEQRQEFNRILEQLHRYATDIEPKLPMYCLVLKQEDIARKLIAIIVTVAHQRDLLHRRDPKYIVELSTLRTMIQQIHQANEHVANVVSSVRNSKQPPTGPPPIGQSGPVIPQRLPISHPPAQPSPQPTHHIPPPPGNRIVPLSQTNPAKKKTVSASASTTAPTPPPVPSVSTPVPNASTPIPSASSPQAPKSPKGKPKARASGPAKRKPSKVLPSSTNSPVQLPAQPPTQPAGTGSKRSREDEVIPITAGPSGDPSPKRVKSEWEGEPTEALVKKQEEVVNIKTEEDASAYFLEQLIKLSTAGEVDISETFDLLLKGYGSNLDALEGSGSSSMTSLDLGDVAAPQDLSPPRKPPTDEFVEFFDFSSFTTLDDDEDSTSKAPTPDLVSSSSTNPSPGSEADAAGHHASADIKTEDFLEASDPLRLGPWKEIDGGESAFYQADNWKWDGPMPTLDQPWAIFNTS